MRISHENRPTGIRAARPVAATREPDAPGTGTQPDSIAALAVLRKVENLDVAPHVAAHLARRLQNDPEAIRQSARVLSTAQLRGHAALPDPLPLVPAVNDEWGDSVAALDDDCRRALLIACVSVSRRTDTLLAATGLTVGQVVAEPLSEFLTLVSGHFVVVDPRIRCVVHESATLAERTTAHARLAHALRERGRAQLGSWHAALATLEGDPTLVPELLSLSRAALRRGDSIWAFHVAREAASQADGADRARADLAAGISALHSGYLDDAVYSLGRVARCGTAGLVRRSLAPYAIAVTLSTGYVPDAEIAEHEAATILELARTGVAPAGSDGVVASLAAAAALHAERGDRDAALDALQRGESLARATTVTGTSSGYLEVARSWCAAFGIELPTAGQPVDPASIEPRWLTGYLVASASITLARAGHVALAESTLSAARLRLSRDTARAVDGGPEVAATPLLAAHLDCAAALVAVIAGTYSSAANRLEQAALDGPVELVFGQLAATAASRMRVLMTGTADNTVPAPAAPAGGPPHRRAALVDRAFAHAFAGRPHEAAPLMALANELAASRVDLLLPEPDEVVLWAAAAQPQLADTARRNLFRNGLVRNGLATGDEPDSGTGWLASLRATLELGSAHEVARLRDAAAETCRGVVSVYERAQTELVLSRALTRAGDPDSARTHAVAAIELFFQTGATALVTHARDLLSTSASGEGSTTAADWARELTEREREVASLVVLGTSNRDAARHLHLSVRTIEVHLARVFAKLDVHSRTELSYLVHGSRTRADRLRDDRA